LPAAFAQMQLFPQILNGRPAVHHFAAPDLLQAARNLLPQLAAFERMNSSWARNIPRLCAITSLAER
jgi:hypothetical protein